jgi:hypothetical protein
LDISEVPIVMTTKFLATVMVLGVVRNEGDVMPLHFFANGSKIDAEEHIKVLQKVMKPWMDSLATGCNYTYQQDGASGHNTKMTEHWCAANLPELWFKELATQQPGL